MIALILQKISLLCNLEPHRIHSRYWRFCPLPPPRGKCRTRCLSHHCPQPHPSSCSYRQQLLSPEIYMHRIMYYKCKESYILWIFMKQEKVIEITSTHNILRPHALRCTKFAKMHDSFSFPPLSFFSPSPPLSLSLFSPSLSLFLSFSSFSLSPFHYSTLLVFLFTHPLLLFRVHLFDVDLGEGIVFAHSVEIVEDHSSVALVVATQFFPSLSRAGPAQYIM